MKLQIRKTIALVAITVLCFLVIYVTITGVEINQTGMLIVTLLSSCVTWYFAKSTALDVPKGEPDDSI